MIAATLDHLPPIEKMARNIVAMIERERQIAETARAWYPRSNNLVRRLAIATRRSEFLIASLLAVLSPSVDWHDDNRHMAIQLLRDPASTTYRNAQGRTCKMQGYGANIRKARLIIETGDASYCRGPKVERFRDALLGLLDNDAVIDIHATNIATGQINHFSGPSNPAVYAAIVSAYIIAADALGWHVCEVQAASWTVYKSTKPKKVAAGQLSLGV